MWGTSIDENIIVKGKTLQKWSRNFLLGGAILVMLGGLARWMGSGRYDAFESVSRDVDEIMTCFESSLEVAECHDWCGHGCTEPGCHGHGSRTVIFGVSNHSACDTAIEVGDEMIVTCDERQGVCHGSLEHALFREQCIAGDHADDCGDLSASIKWMGAGALLLGLGIAGVASGCVMGGALRYGSEYAPLTG